MPWLGTNCTPLPPLHWPGRGARQFLKQGLRACFWANSPSLCQPFFLSTWLFTQPSSDQSWDYLGQGPSWLNSSHLQASLGSPISLVLSQLASTVPAAEHCLSVSPTVSLSPQRLQASRSPLVWDWHPCCERGGSCKVTIGDLALLQISCCSHLPWHQTASQSPFCICFSMSSAVFGFQTSYKLGSLWLFTLFFRRSARCPSWVLEQVDSAPTYFYAIFQSFILFDVIVNRVAIIISFSS